MRPSYSKRWLLALLLAACGGDCSCSRGCGEGGVDATGTLPGPGAGPHAGAAGHSAARPPGSAGAAGAPASPPGAATTASGASPAPAGEAPPEVLGELIEASSLRAVLPRSVGDLQAHAPALDGPPAHERRPVRNVSRRYKHGARDLYLEIIDTAQAPELRANVGKMLTDASALQAPVREAGVLAGSTAVTTGFPAQHASGVMALLNGRYFVNARLEGSDDMQEALRLLQAMDWSTLTARGDGAAGGGAR